VLKVLHVITGLETGGAETSLVRLIAAMGPSVLHSVVSLTSRGTQASAIERLGASVHALNWPRSVPGPSAMRALLLHTRSIQPDVVHGWMYHGSLAASSAAWACARTPRVIWGVRHALDAWSCESPRLRRTIRLSALSSRSAQHIVYNSERARRQHEALGFRADRSVVIPNGFDLMRFAPDQASRSRIRAELRLPPDAPLVGLVARVDPLKDHATFLAAACITARHRPDVHFVLAGRGTDAPGTPLQAQIAAAGLAERVHCLGERRDVPELFASFDIAALTSLSEGFPNTVGEAMACGTPCVATSVGDVAEIVGDAGIVVPPGDPTATARAWCELLARSAAERTALGARARSRIGAQFAMSGVAARFLALYRVTSRAQAA
jgi:glycosyltransferase involved in cell wall biosynthesis